MQCMSLTCIGISLSLHYFAFGNQFLLVRTPVMKFLAILAALPALSSAHCIAQRVRFVDLRPYNEHRF